jgi:hypothetical protein
MFLDGPEGRPTQAIHLLFAGEIIREGDNTAAPVVEESEPAAEFRVVSLEALARMYLASFHIKDRMYLRDFIGVGQIDQTWPSRLSPVLAQRLQQLLDTPNG